MVYYFWYGMRTNDDLGFLLAKASQRFNERLLTRFAESGFPEVRASYGSVLMPLFQQDDLRVGELGTRAALSKQSMTALVAACEADGLVERRRDPDDGRAFRVRLTRRGRRFQGIAESVLAELDAEIRELLGNPRREALVESLRGLMRL
jgi:DNA-binding MarR family transcriptional regulator